MDSNLGAQVATVWTELLPDGVPIQTGRWRGVFERRLFTFGNASTVLQALLSLDESESTGMTLKHSTVNSDNPPIRSCLRDPIPEIFRAAFLLDEAVCSRLAGLEEIAKNLVCEADLKAVRDWTESIWGKNSPYVKPRMVPNPIPRPPEDQRLKVRMPNTCERQLLHLRDGYHCRFCGIPLIPMEIRDRFTQIFEDVKWESSNLGQHAALQAMWLQYDHVIPHARGGTNSLSNLVITCAPCNYGRGHYTLEEVGLSDPRDRPAVCSSWDGLVRPYLFPKHVLPFMFSNKPQWIKITTSADDEIFYGNMETNEVYSASGTGKPSKLPGTLPAFLKFRTDLEGGEPCKDPFMDRA